jgi:Universal stress protein family
LQADASSNVLASRCAGPTWPRTCWRRALAWNKHEIYQRQPRHTASCRDASASSSDGRRTKMKPVMLATDGSPAARRATSAAINLARQVGGELVIVAVWAHVLHRLRLPGLHADCGLRRSDRAGRDAGPKNRRRGCRECGRGRSLDAYARAARLDRGADLPCRRPGPSPNSRSRVARLGSVEARSPRERVGRCSPRRVVSSPRCPGSTWQSYSLRAPGTGGSTHVQGVQ